MLTAELSRFERRLLTSLLTNPTRLLRFRRRPGYEAYLQDLLQRQRRALLRRMQATLAVAQC